MIHTQKPFMAKKDFPATIDLLLKTSPDGEQVVESKSGLKEDVLASFSQGSNEVYVVFATKSERSLYMDSPLRYVKSKDATVLEAIYDSDAETQSFTSHRELQYTMDNDHKIKL
jgi:hypothetical protein